MPWVWQLKKQNKTKQNKKTLNDKAKCKPRVIRHSNIKFLFQGRKNSPQSITDPNQHGNQPMRT